MAEFRSVIAEHPIQDAPYDKIKFSRINSHGVALYRVGKDPREVGAREALRTALGTFGASCFHCGARMKGKKLSHDVTRDHVRAKKDGGGNELHNLVFSCGACNRKKGGDDLVNFSPDKGKEYMKALEAHITRCLAALGPG